MFRGAQGHFHKYYIFMEYFPFSVTKLPCYGTYLFHQSSGNYIIFNIIAYIINSFAILISYIIYLLFICKDANDICEEKI